MIDIYSDDVKSVTFEYAHYDNRSNKFHIWECINGQKQYSCVDGVFTYYHYSKTPTGIIDTYGNHMSPKTTSDMKEIKKANEYQEERETSLICEGDIQPIIKLLNARYERIKPKIKMTLDTLSTMFYDIETACEDKFTEPKDCEVPVNAITAIYTETKEVICWAVPTHADGEVRRLKPITLEGIAQRIRDNSKDGGKRVGRFLDKFVSEYTLIVKEYVSYNNTTQNEIAMLVDFVNTTKAMKVHCITGWNNEQFDDQYIFYRLNALGIGHMNYSPLNSSVIKTKKVKNKKTGNIQLIDSVNTLGVTCLDYQRLYKEKFTYKAIKKYSLNFVAEKELKIRKLEHEGKISDEWKHNWQNWIEYNIVDTIIVYLLEMSLGFIELSLMVTQDSLVPLDFIFSTIGGHTGKLLQTLHARGMVQNNKRSDPYKEMPFAGGHTKALRGRYDFCLSFDVKSLYPTLIIRDNIGAETLVHVKEGEIPEIKATTVYIEMNGEKIALNGYDVVNVLVDGIPKPIYAYYLEESHQLVI